MIKLSLCPNDGMVCTFALSAVKDDCNGGLSCQRACRLSIGYKVPVATNTVTKPTPELDMKALLKFAMEQKLRQMVEALQNSTTSILICSAGNKHHGEQILDIIGVDRERLSISQYATDGQLFVIDPVAFCDEPRLDIKQFRKATRE